MDIIEIPDWMAGSAGDLLIVFFFLHLLVFTYLYCNIIMGSFSSSTFGFCNNMCVENTEANPRKPSADHA